MVSAYHDWVQALAVAGKKPKPHDGGKSHTALCPAHDDVNNHSLSISHGDKTDVVVKCFVGCTFDQIRTSLFGVNGASDTAVTRKPSSVPAVTASTPPKPQALPSGTDIQHWTYCDKDGQVVFQVVRSPGKRFSQWTPVAAGLYISRKGPTGLKPLYFLPDILKSTGTVAIVEGEKCADAARAAWPTQVFTTWAGGALNWNKTDWTPLKGRHVSLLADADPVDEKLGFRPGHKGMLDLAQHLCELGCTVSIGLPMDGDSTDVEDWIKRDGSVAAAARLKELKEDFPLPEPVPSNPYEERVLEYRNPQSTSEFAFVYRFLSYAPEWFLVATTDDERPAALYLLQDKLGVWTRSIDRIGIVWKESIDEWLAVFGKAASESLAKSDIDNVIKATRRMKSAASLKASLKCVGTVALDMKRRDSESPLTICDRRRLDENPRYVGTQSGVFDLDTGLVLAPTEGRLALVTRTIPTTVDMNATHPFVASLMDRLPTEEREFMLDAIAYAARRKPSRRIYFVVGPPGGGKSTLANALLATVGWVGDRGYGVVVDSSGIITGGKMRTKNAHHGALIGMQEAMFAIVPELPPGSELDYVQLCSLSGEDAMALRDVSEKVGANALVTATMFIFCNDETLQTIDFSHKAFRERAKIIRFPGIPKSERDSSVVTMANSNQGVQQALFAEIARRTMKYAGLSIDAPLPPPVIEEAAQQQYEASVSRAVEWADSHIEVTGRNADFMSRDALWDAICEVIPPAQDGRIEGQSRDQVLGDIVRDNPLPKRAKMRHSVRGYVGYRIADGEVTPVHPLVTGVHQKKDEGASDTEIHDSVDEELLKMEARAGAPTVTMSLTVICRCRWCECDSPVKESTPNATVCALCEDGLCPREKAKDGPLPGQTPLDLPTMGGKSH